MGFRRSTRYQIGLCASVPSVNFVPMSVKPHVGDGEGSGTSPRSEVAALRLHQLSEHSSSVNTYNTRFTLGFVNVEFGLITSAS
jgi:hypothetical protein